MDRKIYFDMTLWLKEYGFRIKKNNVVTACLAKRKNNILTE